MTATSLILNSPYTAPARHWQPGSGGALVEATDRRPANYEIFDIRNNTRRSETLIWWVEGAPEFRQGIFLPGDGGPWQRVCSKMATGTGKTLDAWVQAVNAKGGFGLWCWDVAFQPAQIQDILEHHAK